jgi:hypothetical protein
MVMTFFLENNLALMEPDTILNITEGNVYIIETIGISIFFYR